MYVLKEPDHQCYDIAHVLAPITMASRKVQAADGSEALEYILCKFDRDALDFAISDIAKSEVKSENAKGASAKRKHSREMADDGRNKCTTTSARGRVITAVQYHA
eukprot:TRINITY_DN31275_c0_g1_i1.p1 TRINITY_DN31275_c0_g1~~TRINITY_DN31275_c0_g1_i1.p1  ORF type:complete len:105 (+),score=17.89 TRINITY_DN31275_c0_g1_i1:396-710(+)